MRAKYPSNKKIISVKIRKPLISVKDFSAVTEPKAEMLDDFLKAINANGLILIAADKETAENENLKEAVKGLPMVKIVAIDELQSQDVAVAECIVTTEAAVNKITERL